MVCDACTSYRSSHASRYDDLPEGYTSFNNGGMKVSGKTVCDKCIKCQKCHASNLELRSRKLILDTFPCPCSQCAICKMFSRSVDTHDRYHDECFQMMIFRLRPPFNIFPRDVMKYLLRFIS
jgi:hypothetical protein